MDENMPPPPPPGRDDMYADMQKLYDDSQRVKRAHFIAAQHKKKKATYIGGMVVILNVLIGSGLIEALVKSEGAATTVIKAFAFLAASLAAIQTFFNFQKEVECHTTSGDVYSSINRRLGKVMAKYTSNNPASRAEALKDYDALSDEYLKANDAAKPCVPSDGDFEKARAGMREKGK